MDLGLCEDTTADSAAPGKIRVAIVDDHPMVRAGLESFLRLAPDVEIVGVAKSGTEAIGLAVQTIVDVMLMDLLMPDKSDGVQAIRRVLEIQPDLRILALTSSRDELMMLTALQAGAVGYIQKDVSPDDLIGAIRQADAGRSVLEGEALRVLQEGLSQSGTRAGLDAMALPDEQTDVQPGSQSDGSRSPASTRDESASFADRIGGLPADQRPHGPLTPREQAVLEQLAQGLANKEIADVLGISEKTVKVHVSHIFAKLNVYDRTQAVIVASRLGLVKL